MFGLPESVSEPARFNLAMRTKVSSVLCGIVILLGGLATVWSLATVKSSASYRETNAIWKIQGLCTNSQSGRPIKGGKIEVSFREPIAFKHHWRNPPPLATTNVFTTTDDQGRFEVIGKGGSAYIKVHADGYLQTESWDDWSYSARNGIDHVDTNVAFSLKPILHLLQ